MTVIADELGDGVGSQQELLRVRDRTSKAIVSLSLSLERGDYKKEIKDECCLETLRSISIFALIISSSTIEKTKRNEEA